MSPTTHTRPLPATVRHRTRRTVDTPLVLVAAYVVGIVLTAGLVPAGAAHHTGIALGAFAAAAAVIGLNARPVAAPIIAVIAWLFFDGFLVNRHAHLNWDPHADPVRLAILTASALLASLLALAVERYFGIRVRRLGGGEGFGSSSGFKP